MPEGLCRSARIVLLLLYLAIAGVGTATAQTITLPADPQHTSIKFTLQDVLHTIKGTFHLEHATLQFDPATNKLDGEIIVDAKSGESGSGMRDRKMHKEVLESDQYPEISFRPDKVEGSVARQGKSSVKVHGRFTIHGVDREITVLPFCDYFNAIGLYSLNSYSLSPVTTEQRVAICRPGEAGSVAVPPYAGPCPPK